MEQTSDTPRIIDIPRINDPRGNLSFIQQGNACPFAIERVYWVYDIPSDRLRHGRALRATDELIIALAGAFNVTLTTTDGTNTTYKLDRCFRALYVPHGTWREISDFTSGSVAMVLASTTYDETDYIRDYKEYTAQ